MTTAADRYEGLAMREELLRGTPIADYKPRLSAEACAVIARVLDDNRADRARRRLEARGDSGGGRT